MLGIPYGNIATIVVFFLIVRVWFRYGAKIPLTFMAIWIVMYFTLPYVPKVQFPFELFVCFLAIVLLMVDKVKSAPWRYRFRI